MKTPDTQKVATPQEIINKVWQWFVVDVHPQAYDPVEKRCKYRTDTGEKCAVGCLIPDDKYDPDIEGMMGSSLTMKDWSLCEYIGKDTRLIYMLQDAHDIWTADSYGSFQEFMKNSLMNIAKEFDCLLPETPNE